MRFLGARVVLTPAAEKGTGMLNKATELAETHGWFLCRQFENEANADMHARTTAPEILAAFEGEQLDYWVTGYGTGGTLKGVARVLREKSPDTKIVVCEPDNSPLLGSGIEQQRDAKGIPSASHPAFRSYLMQGWTPDFISRLTEDVVDSAFLDQIMPIDGQEALRLSKALAQEEGIFVGISAGATFSGALEIAKSAPAGSNILCMLPDTGERSLSTPLFENISEAMTQEEIDLSQSTPGYRFDSKSSAAATEELEVEAAALKQHTSIPTIPQIFVGGTFIGGCTETFDAFKNGSLQKLLKNNQVDFDQSVKIDPYSLLPKWLQPR